jgi:putative ABC transport system substrate-binding protein
MPKMQSSTGPEEYGRAFKVIIEEGASAVVVSDAPENLQHRKALVELAQEHRIAVIYPNEEHVRLGGLCAYAVDFVTLSRLVARIIGRVLSGAKPNEIPFEQASRFKLLLNLNAAAALGLTVSPSLLARADEVIE